MNAQDLKNSILQLAIQGKLVEQREEEGTAKELLERIESEKNKLIKEGKIKKTKPLPEITEDEIPFDIPGSWKWTRLSKIIDVRDGTHDTPKYVAKGIPLVTSKNLKQGEIDFDNVKLISMEDSKKINIRSGVDEGDILFAMIGSIGNPVLVKKSRDFSIKNMALFKSINITLFNMEYLLNFLQLEQECMKRKAAGGVQSFVSLSFLRSYLVPLPPIEEQKRIVAKIEELKPYVDKYDTAYSEVVKLNKKFPEDMQKSILQYAIQGKLVEQREEDGTAEELYQQIQEEKKKLIKEGKIKKTKVLTEITENDIPFDIPENWKWIRLGDLFNVSTGMTPSKTNPLFHENGEVPWITSAQTGELKIEKAKNFITKRAVESTSLNIYPKHTLLIAMYGQGKTRGQISELLLEATINQACAALENIIDSNILRAYIFYFQIYNYDISRTGSEGSAQPNLNLGKIRHIMVPLPPIKEQKRVVEKIEKLLHYTKNLVK